MSVNGVNGPKGIHAILQDIPADNAEPVLSKDVVLQGVKQVKY